MVGHVPEQVADISFPEGILAPHVLGTPIPAFPAVGVADLPGKAPGQFEQMGLAAMRAVDEFGFTMAAPWARMDRGP